MNKKTKISAENVLKEKIDVNNQLFHKVGKLDAKSEPLVRDLACNQARLFCEHLEDVETDDNGKIIGFEFSSLLKEEIERFPSNKEERVDLIPTTPFMRATLPVLKKSDNKQLLLNRRSDIGWSIIGFFYKQEDMIGGDYQHYAKKYANIVQENGYAELARFGRKKHKSFDALEASENDDESSEVDEEEEEVEEEEETDTNSVQNDDVKPPLVAKKDRKKVLKWLREETPIASVRLEVLGKKLPESKYAIRLALVVHSEISGQADIFYVKANYKPVLEEVLQRISK